MILSPFGKGGGRGFPFHETFLLRVQFGPIWSRGESKRNLRAEDRGSKLLPLYQLYYTCDDLVWNFISSLFAPNFLPSILPQSCFADFFASVSSSFHRDAFLGVYFWITSFFIFPSSEMITFFRSSSPSRPFILDNLIKSVCLFMGEGLLTLCTFFFSNNFLIQLQKERVSIKYYVCKVLQNIWKYFKLFRK